MCIMEEVWIGRHVFIKEQCLCKAQKLEISAISGEVTVGERLVFLYMSSCTAGIFSYIFIIFS